MKKLEREDLVPLQRALTTLLDFVKNVNRGELPYFYKFVKTMKNNVQICICVEYEGWEQLETILKRDWSAANHVFIGIPDYTIREENVEVKHNLDIRFLELISNINYYLK